MADSTSHIPNVSPSPYTPKAKGVGPYVKRAEAKEEGKSSAALEDTVDIKKALKKELNPQISEGDMERYLDMLKNMGDDDSRVEEVRERLERGEYGLEAIQETACRGDDKTHFREFHA